MATDDYKNLFTTLEKSDLSSWIIRYIGNSNKISLENVQTKCFLTYHYSTPTWKFLTTVDGIGSWSHWSYYVQGQIGDIRSDIVNFGQIELKSWKKDVLLYRTPDTAYEVKNFPFD